jgi:hypothetical protein
MNISYLVQRFKSRTHDTEHGSLIDLLPFLSKVAKIVIYEELCSLQHYLALSLVASRFAILLQF